MIYEFVCGCFVSLLVFRVLDLSFNAKQFILDFVWSTPPAAPQTKSTGFFSTQPEEPAPSTALSSSFFIDFTESIVQQVEGNEFLTSVMVLMLLFGIYKLTVATKRKMNTTVNLIHDRFSKKLQIENSTALITNNEKYVQKYIENSEAKHQAIKEERAQALQAIADMEETAYRMVMQEFNHHETERKTPIENIRNSLPFVNQGLNPSMTENEKSESPAHTTPLFSTKQDNPKPDSNKINSHPPQNERSANTKPPTEQSNPNLAPPQFNCGDHQQMFTSPTTSTSNLSDQVPPASPEPNVTDDGRNISSETSPQIRLLRMPESGDRARTNSLRSNVPQSSRSSLSVFSVSSESPQPICSHCRDRLANETMQGAVTNDANAKDNTCLLIRYALGEKIEDVADANRISCFERVLQKRRKAIGAGKCLSCEMVLLEEQATANEPQRETMADFKPVQVSQKSEVFGRVQMEVSVTGRIRRNAHKNECTKQEECKQQENVSNEECQLPEKGRIIYWDSEEGFAVVEDESSVNNNPSF